VQVRLDRTEDDDRLVVQCDEPLFRDALGDLFFHEESGGHVKRFPRDSVTEAILARLEQVLLPMLRQTARLEPAPWEAALRETARRLDGAAVDWWLAGSGALAVRGLAVQPRDLDLVVSGEDAARTAMAFEDALTEPAVEAEGWFSRWFGRAWLGARIEWVGGVTDAADRPEPSDFGLVAAAALSEVRWQGLAVRVPPIELQREVSKRRGLSQRVRLIDALG
jgi:hypothetical protein